MLRKNKLFTFVLIFEILNFSFAKEFSFKKSFNKINVAQRSTKKIQNENPDEQKSWEKTNLSFEQEIFIWKKSYPDVQFKTSFDKEKKDYKIVVTNYGKSQTFYWANGLYLPEKDLSNKSKFWKVITPYNKEPLNPKNFSAEQIQNIKEFSSAKNRKNGRVSSKAIFDAIYDSSTRRSTEQHIKQITFLGKYSNVHEYLIKPLARVERKILALKNKNQNVAKFLAELSSCDSYNWREIRDANTKSFHSFGIAIDILPKRWGSKIVYWGFERDKGNSNWMLIPLEQRWMPPQEVIDIFYDEGFIWGGTWAIWDNMHFEYHPEMINSNIKFDKSSLGNFHFTKFNYNKNNIEDFFRDYVLEFFIIGFLFIVVFYNLILFCFNKKQLMYFFLMFLCLDFILVTTSVDSNLLGSIFTIIPPFVINKITIVSIALLIPFFSLSTFNFFDIKIHKYFLFIYFQFVFAIAMIFFQIAYFDILLLATLIWIFFCASFLLSTIFHNLKRKSKIYSVYFFVSILYLTTTLLLIIFDSEQIFLFKLGFLMFVLVESVLANIKRDIRFEKINQYAKDFQKVKDAHYRFVSTKTLKTLQIPELTLAKSGKKIITDSMIFVIRIRNFYNIQKELGSEKSGKILSKYFGIVTRIVTGNGGIVAHCFSDEIVILFSERNDVVCRNAIAVQKELEEEQKRFNKIAGKEIKLEFEMAIHSGKVAIGLIGTKKYLSPTSCSKEIIVAQKLARKNQELNSTILISDLALAFCRTYADCLFDGEKIYLDESNRKDFFVYKIIPYKKEN